MDQMIKKLAFGVALASGAVLAACRGDGGTAIFADNGSVAYVRFVNAIPDSGGQDWRFVDKVEGSPSTYNLSFRGVFPGATYQQASSGSRHLRVFQASLDQSYQDPTQASPEVVSTVFVDTTITLEEGHHYSLIAVGSLAAGTAKLLFLEDDFADPGSEVAIRVVNLGAAASLDAYASATGGSSALPAPLVSGLAMYAASDWMPLATGALALRANAAGSTTLPAMVDAAAPAGEPADKDKNLTAVGGSTIAGSAFTAFVFPRATAGTRGALVVKGTCPTRCTTAGVVFAVDKYPPSGF
jgi:hypothetical protein